MYASLGISIGKSEAGKGNDKNSAASFREKVNKSVRVALPASQYCCVCTLDSLLLALPESPGRSPDCARHPSLLIH